MPEKWFDAIYSETNVTYYSAPIKCKARKVGKSSFAVEGVPYKERVWHSKIHVFTEENWANLNALYKVYRDALQTYSAFLSSLEEAPES
jgi:hypothetical protein